MNVKSDTINFFPNNMSVPNQEFVNVTLYGNRVSVDVVKNLVMGRLYWIIQAGLKCDHMCPIGGWGVEGWAEGDCTHAERRQCEDGTERDFKILLLKSGVMWLQPRNVSSHQKLKEARNRYLPRSSRGSMVMLTPAFQSSDADLTSGLYNKFLLFWVIEFMLICCISHSKLKQILILRVGYYYNKFLQI